MTMRRKAELVLFSLAGVMHLALGWHYRTADFAFFRHQGWLPFATLFVAAVYVGTGFGAGTKWRVQAIIYAKVIAVLYLVVLFETYGSIPELIQIFPSLLVLTIRNEVWQ